MEEGQSLDPHSQAHRRTARMEKTGSPPPSCIGPVEPDEDQPIMP